MRVWVDLTNSPHAMFFAPIVARLRERGDDVVVTARRFAHTVELARSRFPDVVEIGAGSKQSLFRKVTSLGDRVAALRDFAKAHRPDVAVSHGSVDQSLAARSLGVPALVSVDYEYQPANHITFRAARALLLPQAFADEDVRRRGAGAKTRRYVGLKEETYLAGFEPDHGFRAALDVGETLVTLRPPPVGALYHRGSNPLWDNLTDHLRRLPGTTTLVVPRHPADVGPLTDAVGGGNIRVLSEVVDGPNLLWSSDLVISGGGTMNREAVALGTPVWSMFAGRLGAVDRGLIEAGRMQLLSSVEATALIRPVPRQRSVPPRFDADVTGQFVDAIDRAATATPPARTARTSNRLGAPQ